MNKIFIETITHQPIQQVWACYTQPEHVVNWNFASPDWHCPKASNNLAVGGEFCYTMAAKDRSFMFDFEGTFTEIIIEQKLAYKMADSRMAEVFFEKENNAVKISILFDPENENPIEMQQAGWQAILNQFKTYVESF